MRPGSSTICRMERAVTLLPLPLSPTTHRVLPRSTSKDTPSTALMVAGADREVGAQVAHLEQQVGA